MPATLSASGPASARFGDDAEIAEPLDGGAGDEDGALEGVGHSGGTFEDPGHAGEQPVDRLRAAVADVHEHEAAGAVGVLGHARGEAGLAEQRRGLVSGHPGDGNAGAEPTDRLGGDAGPPTRRADLRKALRGNVEQFGQLVVPTLAPDVVEQGPAGVGRVRGMNGAAGEAPQQPAVDGADRQAGPRGDATFGEEPLDLGRREVRVEDEAGAVPDQAEVADGSQLIAAGRGPPVLPHDGPVERPARGAVPDDRRFPLVGDADGGDGVVQLIGHQRDAGRHGLPDLLGVVLHPARPRVVLGELTVGPGDRLAGLVDRQGAHTGRAGIDGDDRGHCPDNGSRGAAPGKAGPTGPHEVTPAGPPVSQAYPLSKGRGLEIAKRDTVAEGAASAMKIVLPVSTLSSNPGRPVLLG